MKRLLGSLFVGLILVLGAGGCGDDNVDNNDKIDEDDTNFGPGDGNDETGPGR